MSALMHSPTKAIQQFLVRKQRVFGLDVPNWALVAGLGGAAVFVWMRLRKPKGAPMPADTPKTIADYLNAQTTAGLPPVDFMFMDMIYPPKSVKAIVLFTAAAKQAGLPAEWGKAEGLHYILGKESGGYVGRPNYQFGELAHVRNRAEWPRVWRAIQADTWRGILAEPFRSGDRGAQSSATGLGQLTVTNIKSGKYYPSGVKGIGIPLEEAIGMLTYIKDRYKTPELAMASYGKPINAATGGPKSKEGY